jgi:hypothetical protein
MTKAKTKTYPDKPVLNFELEKRLRRPMPLAALKPSTSHLLRTNCQECNWFFKQIEALGASPGGLCSNLPANQ